MVPLTRSRCSRFQTAIATVLLLAVLLCVAACGAATASGGPGTGGPATGSSEVTLPPPASGTQGTSVTDITMPQPDSPNVPIYRALGWENVYVLYWLQMQDGWAYIHGIPFTSTDGPTIDTRALLRRDQTGEWQVLEKSTNEGLLTDVGQAAEDQEIPDQFGKMYPEAPAGIFPEARAEDRLIMDGVRAALGDPVYRFNVFLLNEDKGWAYTELRALRYQAGRIAESLEERALLKQIGGAWTVQQMASMEGTSQRDFIADLKQRYPDVPVGILP